MRPLLACLHDGVALQENAKILRTVMLAIKALKGPNQMVLARRLTEHSIAPAASRLLSRHLCSSNTAKAWATLDLEPGADRSQIKKRFYELAKQTHPDVAAAEESASSSSELSFLDIHAAFEILMHEDEERERLGGTKTSAAGAARGGSRSRRSRRPGAKVVERERSLGELLCDRLEEEPSAAREVWDDLVRDQLRVTEAALEAIFRACGAKDGGGGLAVALEILRDARERELLTRATREAAIIFIIKWCKEDSSSFARIMGELEEADKTREVRENLAYANALYSGMSDGYSAS